MNYNPPSFRKPQQFDGSLDGIFEQYQAMKAAKEQSNLQGIALRDKYGTDPRGMTPAQLDRGFEGPFMPSGPTQTGQPMAPQFDNDPHVAAIQRFMEQKKSAASMASQEQTLGMDKTRSEINKNNAQADSYGRDQVFVDPTTGKQITIPKGAKLLPPAAKQEGKILPASNVMAMNEGQAVARMLPDVENAIKKNENIMGPIGGRGRSLNPYDTNAQTTDAQLRVASQAFGRFMEGGVLRKEDEEKYRKMFPQLSDTPDVAKNKLAIVRRNLAKKYESDRETMGKSGYDVSGLSALQIPPSMFEAQDGNGKIRVSNGSEILLIDAADEADAAKDGYVRAQ